MLKKPVNLAYRFLARILSGMMPQTITLSPTLYLFVDSDKLTLSDNWSERYIDLSRDQVRTFLHLARLASSSGQIRAINFDDFAIEIDGRPSKPPIVFDYNPISWIWKPQFTTLKPTTDYIRIDLKWASGRIRGVIENAKLDLACTEFSRMYAELDSQPE